MDEGQNKGRLASWMTKENLKIFGIVNLGTLLLSVGVYFFKFPNHFTTGGVSGISIILGKFFPNISSATFVAAINIILLILGFLFIGRSFGILTAYCSLMYSLETWLFEWLFPMDAPFTDQPLLELCFAIFLPAVGSALLFNYNASSGGTDIVAMILKKYSSIGDIGKALMISDSLIAVSSCFIFGMQVGMFSLLGLFLKSFVVDSVVENINLCKCFFIITTKPDEINDYVIHKLHHSSTILHATGGYSHTEEKVVMVACRRREAVWLRQVSKRIDPHSFMLITNSSEIIGKGFLAV